MPTPDPHPPLAPTTTSEQDLATRGQRRINIIWEVTQAVVATVVTTGTLIVTCLLVLRGGDSAATALLLLSNAFFMILATYFQRTNHIRMGGVPPSTNDTQDHR